MPPFVLSILQSLATGLALDRLRAPARPPAPARVWEGGPLVPPLAPPPPLAGRLATRADDLRTRGLR